MSKITCLILCVVAVSLSKAAISVDEIHAVHVAIDPAIVECSAQFGVSEEDIKTAKATHNTDAMQPCFLACVMKKIEVLDDKGFYDAEKGLGKVKKYVKHEEDFAKIEEVGKACLKVNEEPVSDGEEGCERGKLLIACAMKHIAQLPL